MALRAALPGGDRELPDRGRRPAASFYTGLLNGAWLTPLDDPLLTGPETIPDTSRAAPLTGRMGAADHRVLPHRQLAHERF